VKVIFFRKCLHSDLLIIILYFRKNIGLYLICIYFFGYESFHKNIMNQSIFLKKMYCNMSIILKVLFLIFGIYIYYMYSVI
jgi:hypothetical protein